MPLCQGSAELARNKIVRTILGPISEENLTQRTVVRLSSELNNRCVIRDDNKALVRKT